MSKYRKCTLPKVGKRLIQLRKPKNRKKSMSSNARQKALNEWKNSW